MVVKQDIQRRRGCRAAGQHVGACLEAAADLHGGAVRQPRRDTRRRAGLDDDDGAGRRHDRRDSFGHSPRKPPNPSLNEQMRRRRQSVPLQLHYNLFGDNSIARHDILDDDVVRIVTGIGDQ